MLLMPNKHIDSFSRPDNFFSWLSAAILLVMLSVPLFGNAKDLDIVSIALFACGIFGVVMLWVTMADAPYSLKQVHWVFYVTNFAVAPLFQYTNGVWPWGYIPTNDQVLRVCALVFLWGVIFAIASGRTIFVNQAHDIDNIHWLSQKMTFSLTPMARFILPLGCILSFVLLVAIVGFGNMFLRTTNTTELDSSSLALVIGICPRAFVFGSFALLLLNARRERRYYGGVFIAGACVLLTCFPTAMARFNVAAIYFGIAILVFPAFSKKRGLFAFFLVLGYLVAYPLFNAFKYIGAAASVEEAISTIFDSMTAGYTSGNYDAFSLMFWCADYLSHFGCTYGRQLLGAVLFFVPRSFWPNKPVPSGQLVFSSFHYPFTDLAFPLPFEGCLNFGFIGLPIFALAYGLVVQMLDEKYWKSRMRHFGDSPSTLLIYYPFLLCLTFYMLRGAMMTTFTYVFGDLAVMALLHFLANLLNRKREARRSDCEKGILPHSNRQVGLDETSVFK